MGQVSKVSNNEEGGKPVKRSTRFNRRYEQMLDAATVAVNESGIQRTSLQSVAETLDMTTTSITYYFRYKEHLIAEVFNAGLARLAEIADKAALASSPQARVKAFIELYLDQRARSLLGEIRPMTNLSEIRTLNGDLKQTLLDHYKRIVRVIRGFFGEADTDAKKVDFTARAHLLNETLFWSEFWLSRYPVSDFPNVARRLYDILSLGVANGEGAWKRLIPWTESSPTKIDSPAFIDVATRVINDIGYHGASIDRIMAEMGLTKGSFYHHLDTKAELIESCLMHSQARLRAMTEQAVFDGEPKWCSISAAVGAALSVQLRGDYPLLSASAFQAMPTPIRDAGRESAHLAVFQLAGQFVEAMQDGSVRVVDPLIAGYVMFSAIDSAYDVRGWARQQSTDSVLDANIRILSKGLFDGG